MLTRDYVGSDPDHSMPHESRTFDDGTWRQPATFVRDMAKYPTTAARLAALRSKYPPKSGAPAAWSYDRSGGVGDPAYWFGSDHGANTSRDEKTGRVSYNYGDGIGGDIDRARPFRFVGFADDVCRSIRHTGHFGDDEGTGHTVCRGVVFHIPGKDGAPRFMAGYEWGESTRKGFDSGGGAIECGRGDIYDEKEDAARAADSAADSAADREREYQREESERLAAEEAEAEATEAAEVAEHAADVAAALDHLLKAAAEVGKEADDVTTIRPATFARSIDHLGEALRAYESLAAGPVGSGG